MSTPSITPAQIIAVVGSIVAELVNDQYVTGHTAKLVTGLAGIIVPALWMLADAWIRHGRAKAHAAIVIAGATQHAEAAKTTAKASTARRPRS